MIKIKILDLFKKNKKNDKEKIQTPLKQEIKDIGSISKNSDNWLNNFYFNYSANNNRKKAMTENMDNVIDRIKDEAFNLPLLARAILNVTSKTSDKQFYFTGKNKNNIKKVANKFEEILKESNYNPELFLKESFQNLVKYSNLFIVPFRENDELKRIRIYQNKGWTVKEKIGDFFCKTFTFDIDDMNFGKNKEFKNKFDVFHFTFNKESDEIFAMPIWCSVIPTIKEYMSLLDNALDSYADQSIERIIYEIGVTNNGVVRPVKPDSHNSAKKLLEETDADLIVDFPIHINKAGKNFTSPDKLLEALELQILAGLYTSKGQLGSTSSGRQDAETQDENTELITKSFLKELEFHLNQTVIREICINLFGNYLGENSVELKFEEGFNTKERKEKHAVYLFQGGVIDLDETRKICNYTEDINLKKTFSNLYGNSEMNGTVENTNNPKNQHTTGIGTTKKTKKD